MLSVIIPANVIIIGFSILCPRRFKTYKISFLTNLAVSRYFKIKHFTKQHRSQQNFYLLLFFKQTLL
jgi:hypothetical protein